MLYYGECSVVIPGSTAWGGLLWAFGQTLCSTVWMITCWLRSVTCIYNSHHLTAGMDRKRTGAFQRTGTILAVGRPSTSVTVTRVPTQWPACLGFPISDSDVLGGQGSSCSAHLGSNAVGGKASVLQRPRGRERGPALTRSWPRPHASRLTLFLLPLGMRHLEDGN
jgi:hypothetical protein